MAGSPPVSSHLVPPPRDLVPPLPDNVHSASWMDPKSLLRASQEGGLQPQGLGRAWRKKRLLEPPRERSRKTGHG